MFKLILILVLYQNSLQMINVGNYTKSKCETVGTEFNNHFSQDRFAANYICIPVD